MDFYIENMCAHVLSKISEKGEEYYIFVYGNYEENRKEILRLLGRFASNPQLSFTWYDAAVLSQKIRRQRCKELQSMRFKMPLS